MARTRLKTLAPSQFSIGAHRTFRTHPFGDELKTLVRAEFNSHQVYASMKSLMPGKETPYTFWKIDPEVKWANDNGLKVLANPLVAPGSYTPGWVSSITSKDELLLILQRYVDKVVGHYKRGNGRPHVDAWVVVNEPMARGTVFKNSQSCKWMDLGYYPGKGRVPQYIATAFRRARLILGQGPDLILNENRSAILGRGKAPGIRKLVEDMQAAKIPISAVGLQMHLRLKKHGNGWVLINADNDARGEIPITKSGFMNLVGLYNKMKLKVYITELDIRLGPSLDVALLNAQAKAYGDIASWALEAPNVVLLHTWGIDDNHTWLKKPVRPNPRPLLFKGIRGDVSSGYGSTIKASARGYRGNGISVSDRWGWWAGLEQDIGPAMLRAGPGHSYNVKAKVKLARGSRVVVFEIGVQGEGGWRLFQGRASSAGTNWRTVRATIHNVTWKAGTNPNQIVLRVKTERLSSGLNRDRTGTANMTIDDLSLKQTTNNEELLVNPDFEQWPSTIRFVPKPAFHKLKRALCEHS